MPRKKNKVANLPNTEVGDRLRRIREGKGFTIQAMSFKSGIDPSNYRKYEKGLLGMNVTTLTKMLTALESSWEELEKV